MSVSVELPPRVPKLTGNYAADLQALYDWMNAMTRVQAQLRERTGGSDDAVAANTITAASAAATADAGQVGADIPTEGGSVTLTPSNPLSYALLTPNTARIDVAGHTRSDAGAPLIAAAVSPSVARGATYYVYYSDPTDAGGAQTFLATTSIATVTATPSYKIIKTIAIPAYHYSNRIIEQ